MDHITEHCCTQDENSSFTQRFCTIREEHLSNCIHDNIVDNSIFTEVLFAIVDHLIGSERAYHIDIRCTTNACHVCSHGLCYLYCSSTDCSRGSIDEYFVSTLESCFSEECECCGSSEWDHSCLLVCQSFWLDDKSIILFHASIFCIGPECHIGISEYLITSPEFSDIFSDLHYLS